MPLASLGLRILDNMLRLGHCSPRAARSFAQWATETDSRAGDKIDDQKVW